jgi:probable rRNA maturation factor
MAAVRLYELVPVPWLEKRRELKSMLLDLFKREKRYLHDLNIIFCDDEFLLGINQEFLQHNDFTDIITFDLSDSTEIKGEIYISIPRILENASKLQVDRASEIHRVIFHGCLHLCGYKDKLKKDKDLMSKKEEEYLKRYASRSST